jgi:hypothetical protein
MNDNVKKIITPLSFLEGLPKYFEDLGTNIVQQFTNLFTHSIEANVINRESNIKVMEKKIDFSVEHVEEKKKFAKESLGKIELRYDEMGTELAEEHEHFLKQLDSDAYNMVENIYPKQIQEKFSYSSIPILNYLKDHILESAYVRTSIIDGYEKKMTDATKSYKEELGILESSINDISLDTSLEEGCYEIPYYFIQSKVNGDPVKTEIQFDVDNEIPSVLKQDFMEAAQDRIGLNQDKPIAKSDYSALLKELKSMTDQIPKVELERFMEDLNR